MAKGLSHFDFKIEYLLRIHEGTPGPLDISFKDSTIDYDSLELPEPTQLLQIKTSYAYSTDFSIQSDDLSYHSGEAQKPPSLISSDSISHCRPEYLMET